MRWVGRGRPRERRRLASAREARNDVDAGETPALPGGTLPGALDRAAGQGYDPAFAMFGETA